MLSKIVLLVFCTFTYSIAETYWLTGVEILYKHRNTLADISTPCTYRFPCKKKPCPDKSCDKYFIPIQELINKPIAEWRIKERELWESFFGLAAFQRRARFEKIPGILPNHPVVIEILVNALSYHNTKIQYKAYHYLVNGSPYSLLYNYSDLIEKRLKYSSLPAADKNMLLALSTKSDSVKNELLASDILSLPLRVRLGDTLAESRLFNKFNTDTIFQNREKTVLDIALAGTNRCMIFLIENFNKPYFRKIDTCYTKSIRMAIIEGFQRHQPDISLFNEQWYKMGGLEWYTSDEIQTPDSVKKYLDSVVVFFKKTYNTAPIDPAPFPTLIGTPNCWPASKPVKR